METSSIFLETVPASTALRTALGGKVYTASAPLESARLLTSVRADAIVLSPNNRWAAELVESLAPAQRPAILVVSDGSSACTGLGDQWLCWNWQVAEARRRLRRACERAAWRRLVEETVFVDTETQLPNWRALDRAVISKAERARPTRGPLSLLVLRARDSSGCSGTWLQEISSSLRDGIRRKEVAGRLGRALFALVITGNRIAANGAAIRMTSKLAARGIAIAAETLAIDLARPTAALHQLAVECGRVI